MDNGLNGKNYNCFHSFQIPFSFLILVGIVLFSNNHKDIYKMKTSSK